MQNSVFTENLKSSHGPYGPFGQDRFSEIQAIRGDMALQVGFHISRKRIQGHFRDQVKDLEELRPGTGRKSRCAPFGTTPAAQNPKIWTKIDENHAPGVGGMGEAP